MPTNTLEKPLITNIICDNKSLLTTFIEDKVSSIDFPKIKIAFAFEISEKSKFVQIDDCKQLINMIFNNILSNIRKFDMNYMKNVEDLERTPDLKIKFMEEKDFLFIDINSKIIPDNLDDTKDFLSKFANKYKGELVSSFVLENNFAVEIVIPL